MPSIPIFNKCNNKCQMCSNPDTFLKMQKSSKLKYILKRIYKFYNGEKEFLDNNRDSFVFTGGEPTLSPYFFDILKEIRNFYPEKKIVCLTNGRRFFYEKYTKEILKLHDHLELAVSIHGHNDYLHDKITQVSGSFSQTIKGLENIFRYKKTSQTVEIRIVLQGINFKYLSKITDFIRKNFPKIDHLVFIFFEPEGQAIKNLRSLKLKYAQLVPHLEDIFEITLFFKSVRFYHFPLCVIPIKFFPYVWNTLPKYEVSFLKKCQNCTVKNLCLGIHKGYLKNISTCEFQPIKKKLPIKIGPDIHHPILEINL